MECRDSFLGPPHTHYHRYRKRASEARVCHSTQVPRPDLQICIIRQQSSRPPHKQTQTAGGQSHYRAHRISYSAIYPSLITTRLNPVLR
ncbi:hypothetical protein SeLEV6574_g03066 [Synchytrium endobioticum]|uniref:Uncharacterized protein n=1 Tax=Synchytrium endobioticum TaxID=286115 RepID=A0A507D5J8_9FUNG|nr:hypothetical protein SeLEV6574_g03066 [Synchytrium endobioticum]